MIDFSLIKDCSIKDPRVSIIIPCYNQGVYLRESLHSVLDQTFTNFEVIIIEDNSTDNSIEIIKKHMIRDPRIKVIQTKINSGISLVRNLGYQESRSKYVYNLDCDDMIKPVLIETFYNCICKEGIDFVYCKEEILGCDCGWNTKPFNKKELMKENIVGQSIMCKKTAWETVGGYKTNLKYGEDYEFALNLSNNGYNGLYIETPLFIYRKHQEGATSYLKNEKKEEDLKYIRSLYA